MENKPLLMADLPGRVYRCPDEHVELKKREPDKNSFSYKLRQLDIGEYVEIPKTSAGLVSRICRQSRFVLTTAVQPGGRTLRVTRIK